MRIELEESVLHVHVGSPDFLGEFSVLRVVEVFVLESDKRCRQWDRLSERVRVGENEQDWGWEIARGSDSARTSINGGIRKNLKRGADVGGKINGLPFDWHARPKEEDDEEEDEEEEEEEEEIEERDDKDEKSDDDDVHDVYDEKDQRVFVPIHPDEKE